jgi:hypothetical protein
MKYHKSGTFIRTTRMASWEARPAGCFLRVLQALSNDLYWSACCTMGCICVGFRPHHCWVFLLSVLYVWLGFSIASWMYNCSMAVPSNHSDWSGFHEATKHVYYLGLGVGDKLAVSMSMSGSIQQSLNQAYPLQTEDAKSHAWKLGQGHSWSSVGHPPVGTTALWWGKLIAVMVSKTMLV